MHDRSRLRHTISLQTAWEPAAAGRHGWTRRFGRPLDLPPEERLVLVIGPVPTGSLPRVEMTRTTLNGMRLVDLPAAESLAGRGDATAADPAATGGDALPFARDVTDAVGPRNELFLAADGDAEAERSIDGTRRHRPLPPGVARVWLEVHAPLDGTGAPDHP